MSTSTKHRIGEMAWRVSGWQTPPLDENGDSDWDKAKEFAYICKTEQQAKRLAAKLSATTHSGCCLVEEAKRGYANEYDEEDGIAQWLSCGKSYEV